MDKKIKYFLSVVAAILLLSPAVSAVIAPAFTISYLNSTDSALWPVSDMNVTKGEILFFNDTSTGSPSIWSWEYGDGFTSIVKNSSHTYTFGKGRLLMLQNGWTTVEVQLIASDNSGNYTASKILNLTTPMQRWPMATGCVTLLDESNANAFLAAIGGNTTLPQGWAGFDWLGILHTAEKVYADVLGWTIFLILIFSVPFIMNWIVSKDFVVSGILGGFLGVWIIARLPAQFQLVAVAFIAMSIVAVIYSLLKERV